MKFISFLIAILSIINLPGFSQSGSLDTTFNPGLGANDAIYATALQSDGKIIIGGIFTTYDGMPYNRIARLNPDGSVDPTFNPGTGANAQVSDIKIQSDGKILICGYFTTYNGISATKIARLETDGSLDATFNVTGITPYGQAIAIQSNGRILLDAFYLNSPGVQQYGVVRLYSDGSIDNTFTPGSSANAIILDIVIQANGKILVSGNFSTYNTVQREGIVRLNSNGSVDNSFNPGSGIIGSIFDMDEQPDGKIILSGIFQSYNGVTSYNVIRILSNATLDTTFNPGNGVSGVVKSASLQSDGDIILGGIFNYFNSIPHNFLVMIKANGAIDTSFNTGTGADYYIHTTMLQPDGKLIIAGEFTTYNSTGRNRIARINNCVNTSSTLNVNACESYISPNGSVLNTSGTYTQTIVTSQGCDSVVTINLTIYSTPIVTITASGSLTFCQGDSVILSAPPAMTSYQWYRRSFLIPGATTQDYIAKSTGRYHCIAYNAGLCSDTSNTIIVNVPCILIGPNHNRLFSDESGEQFLHISPNPGTGQFSVKASRGILQIFNSFGQMILSKEIFEEVSGLDLSEYSNGFYFITLRSGPKLNFQKIVLVR